MKKILILLLFIPFSFCSTSDNTEEETQQIEWTVTTTSECSNDASNIHNTYCVTESTYTRVTNEWMSTAPERNCSPIQFEDIQGNIIEGIVESTKRSIGACQNI